MSEPFNGFINGSESVKGLFAPLVPLFPSPASGTGRHDLHNAYPDIHDQARSLRRNEVMTKTSDPNET